MQNELRPQLRAAESAHLIIYARLDVLLLVQAVVPRLYHFRGGLWVHKIDAIHAGSQLQHLSYNSLVTVNRAPEVRVAAFACRDALEDLGGNVGVQVVDCKVVRAAHGF